jgi:hypothetical protein
MTKEEYLDGLDDIVADFNNPYSEPSTLITEFQAMADEVREHDATMADKLVAVRNAIAAFGEYAKTRAAAR